MYQLSETGNKILNAVITGVTGFLGSSLAAGILAAGGSVVAITRDDSNDRTLKAIKGAAEGFGFSLPEDLEDRLVIIETSLTDLIKLDACKSFLKEFSFWHCAADMRYCYSILGESLNINLVKTSELYHYFTQKENCKRFYYVSTAYTAGFNVAIAEEELHFNPKLINAYQTSKWLAEMSIVLSSQKHSLPITIFRPSIICGHTKTGWTGNRKFGLYGILSAISLATKLKSRSLTLAIQTQSRPNFIPIDEVINLALKLQSCQKDRDHMEVIHATADDSLLSSQIRNIINDLWDTNIHFGAPEDKYSVRINRSIQPNLPFLNHVWHFSQHYIANHIDKTCAPFSMTESTMRHIIDVFYRPEKQPEDNGGINFG